MLALNCALATGDNNATRSASEATRMMQLGVRRITGPPLIDIGKRLKADKDGSTKGTKEHKGAFDVLRFLFFCPLPPFVSSLPPAAILIPAIFVATMFASVTKTI